MHVEPVTQLVSIRVEMTAEEAGQLYAELYRLSSDVLNRPYEADSMIGELMIQLSRAEAPGT